MSEMEKVWQHKVARQYTNMLDIWYDMIWYYKLTWSGKTPVLPKLVIKYYNS